MKRLSKIEITTIKKLERNGKSINYICKKLKLYKSVVYYWFKKFRGRTNSKIIINKKLIEELGEVIGAFAGDGNFYVDKNYSYKIRVYLSSKEIWYAKRLLNLYKKIFNREGWIWKYDKKNIVLFRIFGKEIIGYIKKFLTWGNKKTYTVSLKNMVESYDENFLVGFVRGLYLTDGWINKTKKTLGFGTTSYKLFINVLEILTILNIKFYSYNYKKLTKKRFFYLTIPKSEAEKFIRALKIKEVLPTGISGKTI